jgi:hypothetical protein
MFRIIQTDHQPEPFTVDPNATFEPGILKQLVVIGGNVVILKQEDEEEKRVPDSSSR